MIVRADVLFFAIFRDEIFQIGEIVWNPVPRVSLASQFTVDEAVSAHHPQPPMPNRFRFFLRAGLPFRIHCYIPFRLARMILPRRNDVDGAPYLPTKPIDPRAVHEVNDASGSFRFVKEMKRESNIWTLAPRSEAAASS